jgi:hypothetical protein
MKMKIWVFALCFLAVFDWCQAQDSKTSFVDVVYLKDGSVLIGKLMVYEVDKVVEIVLDSGSKVILDYQDVKKVLQYIDPATLKIKVHKMPNSNVYLFREQGWNHQVLLSTLWGRGQWNSLQVGIAAEYILGYRFNKGFGLGIGTGYNNYNLQTSQLILPLYLEQRGYFTDNWIAPTYSLGAGYGFAFKNEANGFEKAEGGPLFNAAIGLRIGALKGINLLADLGLRYQRATYRDNWTWEPGSFNEYRWDYLRWNLRIGVTF